MPNHRAVREVFPAFVAELEDLCRCAAGVEIADQIAELPVLARCDCGQGNCAHFYTAPPPRGAYGPRHRNVVLPAKSGLMVLDIVDDRVVAVEVLDRSDVKQALDAYLPPT